MGWGWVQNQSSLVLQASEKVFPIQHTTQYRNFQDIYEHKSYKIYYRTKKLFKKAKSLLFYKKVIKKINKSY